MVLLSYVLVDGEYVRLIDWVNDVGNNLFDSGFRYGVVFFY